MLIDHSTKFFHRSHRPGFAIVSSLSIVIVLFLLALACLQLSRVESIRSRQDNAQLVADANAKMALEIAISQLQLHTGRDRTTTCRADLIDSRATPLAKIDPTLEHPYYTLAFQTEAVNDDYDHARYGNGIFLRTPSTLPACLVSGNESFNLHVNTPSSYPKNYTTPTSQLDPLKSIELLKSHDKSVRVPLVSVHSNRSPKGNYAYWIGDENIKARVNLEAPDLSSDQQIANTESPSTKIFNSLRASPTLGISTAGKGDTEGFLADLEQPSKYLTLTSVATLGNDQATAIRRHKHDFSTYSQSVLCDLKHGGLKKNLTAALNLDDDEFNHLTEHSDNEEEHPSPVFLYQKWSFPAESENLSYSHYPGVPWELFRSYLRRPEFEPQLVGARPLALSHLGSKAHKLTNYWQRKPTGSNHTAPLHARLVRRSPVLLRFQLGIDYSVGYLGTVTDEQIGTNCHEFELRQHFTPIVSYWNPYNVDLSITEKIEYHTYLDRNWSTGRHNTRLKVHLPSSALWRSFGLHQDSKKEAVGWSSPRLGSSEFYYPYHPLGNTQSKSVLARSSFHVPPFQLQAGKTVLFSVGPMSQKMQFKKSQSNTLIQLEKSTQSGHSFYTSNAKIRISADSFAHYQDAIPELEIVSFPSNGGTERTRLHVTNASSFHRINWNFASITQKAGIRFIPTLIARDEPLPLSDPNGTESPKVSAVVIRKFADIQHYSSAASTWKTPSNSINSNTYCAPWSLFYQSNASRYAAYGAKESSGDSFSSPPQYLTGVILGANPMLQPDLTAAAECFVGYSDRSSSGTNQAIQVALPRAETRSFSPAHLSQLNTSKWLSNYNADHSNASATDALSPTNSIANSFCSPHIPPSASSITVYDRHAYASTPAATQYDTSFRYNEALWDRYFFTGERPGEILTGDAISQKLPARHLTPKTGTTLEDFQDPHRSASQLMLNGGFNVNSTSVEAWKVLLSSTIGKQVPSSSSVSKSLTPFPRLQHTQSAPYSSAPTDPSLPSYYDGTHYRALTTDELQTLAEQIVIQNKLRGPYPTLAQFINRSLSPQHHYRKFAQNLTLTTDQVCYEGAIQSAINSAQINGIFNTNTSKFPPGLTAKEHSKADYEAGKINPKALKYHTGYGAAGTLTQADILSRIGHLLTARSDTFTIRAYGDARDSQGNILATAYCEAIVQRTPEYINPADPAETSPQKWSLTPSSDLPIKGTSSSNPNLSPLSQQFGRRYKVIQFRWLNPKEI